MKFFPFLLLVISGSFYGCSIYDDAIYPEPNQSALQPAALQNSSDEIDVSTDPLYLQTRAYAAQYCQPTELQQTDTTLVLATAVQRGRFDLLQPLFLEMTSLHTQGRVGPQCLQAVTGAPVQPVGRGIPDSYSKVVCRGGICCGPRGCS